MLNSSGHLGPSPDGCVSISMDRGLGICVLGKQCACFIVFFIGILHAQTGLGNAGVDDQWEP